MDSRRNVNLTASNTEIVATLGLLDLVVGVDDRYDFAEDVQKPPRVGSDFERASALRAEQSD